jgi:hypothetical protein
VSTRFSIDANSTAGGRLTVAVDPSGSGVWGPTPRGISRRIPPAISGEQAYFWSASWQEEEAESLREHEVGSFETFDSDDPNDVIRWLLS